MPDKKANKNYNISITENEEIVKQCISEINSIQFNSIHFYLQSRYYVLKFLLKK